MTSNTRTPRPRDASSTFALAAIVVACAAFALAIAGALGASPSGDGDAEAAVDGGGGGDQGDDGAVADPNAVAGEVVASSATAMGAVTSVEFSLRRDGAPIYIDEFERIALDSLRGQFTVPTRAQAELSVTVNGNLATRLGAVAIDEEVWISNPVTGDFETLPVGYDIDPSRFFDPEGGWQPLLANLQDVSIVGIDDRGEQHHRRPRARPGRRGRPLDPPRHVPRDRRVVRHDDRR
jgi:hypothetical protein